MLLGVQVAELQYDDVSREGIYAIIENIADEFGIPKLYIETEQAVDEDGTTHITVKPVDSVDEDSDEEPPSTVH